MSPEAQQVAIAEFMGWRDVKEGIVEDGAFGEYEHSAWIGRRLTDSHDMEIPDFVGDLNAMHEAEKVLSAEQKGAFAWELVAQCLKQSNSSYSLGCNYGGNWIELPCEEIFLALTATAAERAEAFLRTLNLWTD